MENYLESKSGKGKTYVDWSCADNGSEQEHMRNLGKKSWEIQWKKFLSEIIENEKNDSGTII